tara:strand:+ start:4583 stop:4729 length:147 start_codon:yes stop_codon:yes gene_type:complete
MIKSFIESFNSMPIDLKARVLWIAGIVVLVWSFRRYLMTRGNLNKLKK